MGNKTYDKKKCMRGISPFHEFLIVLWDPFSGRVLILCHQDSPLSCYVFVFSPAWCPLRRSSVYVWSWSCYFFWWPRADWLWEPQWGLLLLETQKPLACISLMFPHFLWTFWPCIIDILGHAISINGTTDIFLWQLEINFKSNNSHGESNVTRSLGIRVSGGCCINTQQINNNGG